MTKRIGIIGLGRIGMVAAETYLNHGYTVFGYDCKPEAIASLEQLGGRGADDPAAVAAATETVRILVLNDEQVKAVLTGTAGLLESTTEDSLVICMSTINRSNLEAYSEICEKRGVGFVDCPFTGGPARVPSSSLTLIAAGHSQYLTRAKPILSVIGKTTVVGNTPGMGQAVKHCNQLLVTAIHGATMEVITLAEKSGADPRQVCEIIANGIAGNDYFRLLSSAILDNTDSPGGLEQLWKDVNIVVTTAREHNLPLLVTLATAQYFNMGIAQGMEQEDSSRLMAVLQKMVQP